LLDEAAQSYAISALASEGNQGPAFSRAEYCYKEIRLLAAAGAVSQSRCRVLVLTSNHQITNPESPARVFLILRVMGWKLLNYKILDDRLRCFHSDTEILLIAPTSNQ